MTLDAGDNIAGYEIVARIGAGGMATVYQAYHERLDRNVAIKVLHDTFVRDDSFLERFEREARIIARLEHPHIVPIYDYAESDGRPYFIMKYIEGGTLKRRAIKQGIGLDDMIRMMTLLADALTYAHEKGCASPRYQNRRISSSTSATCLISVTLVWRASRRSAIPPSATI